VQQESSKTNIIRDSLIVTYLSTNPLVHYFFKDKQTESLVFTRAINTKALSGGLVAMMRFE